jgi:hypothetical protein
MNALYRPRVRNAFFAALFSLMGALLCLQPSSGFTVIKNVNTGQPPVEKVVIFDKTKGGATPVTFVSKNCTPALAADGAIQCDITGNQKMSLQINWKPRADLPATFDATQYNFLLLTCRMEGVIHRADPNGKIADLPRGDLYFVATLVDPKDQNVGYCDLANLADDGKTPATTVTLNIPTLHQGQSQRCTAHQGNRIRMGRHSSQHEPRHAPGDRQNRPRGMILFRKGTS